MTLYAPSQAFEHSLTPMKGWPHQAAVDFSAKISANVTFTVPAGRVAHLNASGEYEMGVSGKEMPMFLFQGQADFDVNNPGTSAKGTFVHQAIAPTGEQMALVAAGAYEINSTEFDTSKSYPINALLTAVASNTVLATGGVLTSVNSAGNAVRQYIDAACGVVSRGKLRNEFQQDVISFWPIYMPAASV